MVVVGDKGRAQLTRTHAKNIDEIIQDVGKVRITFAQARRPALIAFFIKHACLSSMPQKRSLRMDLRVWTSSGSAHQQCGISASRAA